MIRCKPEAEKVHTLMDGASHTCCEKLSVRRETFLINKFSRARGDRGRQLSSKSCYCSLTRGRRVWRVVAQHFYPLQQDLNPSLWRVGTLGDPSRRSWSKL